MRHKILIIGSNSFSGSNLVKYLIRNDYFVYGISRSNELKPPYSPYHSYVNPDNFNFCKLDINKDWDKTVGIFEFGCSS